MTNLREVATKIMNASLYTKEDKLEEWIEAILREVVSKADDKWRAKESECLNEARRTIKLLEERIEEARSAARAEAIEECAKIADDEDCVCTDEVNCHGSERIAAKIREMGKV